MSSSKYNQLATNYPKSCAKIKLGVSCGEGWFTLINTTCLVVEHEINQMPLELQDQFKVDQIKQKFGGLRFGMNRTTPYMDGVIHLAESMSYHICEFCGDPASRKTIRGWSIVLCDQCHKMRLTQLDSKTTER